MNQAAASSPAPRPNSPRVSLELIAPSRAADIIARSEGMNFRFQAKNHISVLAAEMSKGEWVTNGSTIVLDFQDRCIDGLHRLHAIVESGVTILTQVLRVPNRDAVDPYIDVLHKNRNATQYTAHAGYKGAKHIASGLRLYWGWEQGQRGSAAAGGGLVGYTPKEACALLDRLGSTAEALVPYAERMRPYALVSQGVFLGTWAVAHGAQQARFCDFADAVHSGADLEVGHPALALRNYGGGWASQRRPISNQVLSLCNLISAWNAFVEGRQLVKVGGATTFAKTRTIPEISVG